MTAPTEPALGSPRPPSTGHEGGRGPTMGRWKVWARRHWCFLVVFFAGFAMRVITQIAYRPILLYIDSFRYLDNLRPLNPTRSEPIGYNAIMLRPLLWVGNLMTVAVVQHLMGLAMGAAIYALLVRYRVRPWLAALAIVPVMLDAYQLQIEHNLLSETLFEGLILAGVVVLLWNQRPSLRALVVAGVLFGVSVSVRSVALPVIVPAVLFVAMVSPAGWRRLRRAAVLAAAFALPVLGSAAFFSAVNGPIGLASGDATLLYGRAATIVDCRHLQLPSYEKLLCPPEPLGHRKGVDEYAHLDVLDKQVRPPPGQTTNQVLRNFALRTFRHQPLDFLHAVFDDFAKGFALSPTTAHNDVPVYRWQFQRSYPLFPGHSAHTETERYGGGKPSTYPALTRFLRAYQLSVGFVPGPLIALAFLAGLLGAAGVGRARRSGLRAACLLPTLTGLTLLIGADLFEFSWRYQLPALVFAPLGAALGLTAMLRRSPPPDAEAAGDDGPPAVPATASAATEAPGRGGARSD